MRRSIVLLPLLGVALLAAGLARRAGEGQAQRLAVASASAVVEDHVDARRRALRATAARIGQLEARPPEALERMLAALAAAYPEMRLVMVCDPTGRVVVAHGGKPEHDRSAARRAAMAAAPHAFAQLDGERLELGEPVTDVTGSPPALYLAADVSTAPLAGRLADLESLSGARLAVAPDLAVLAAFPVDAPQALCLALGALLCLAAAVIRSRQAR